MYIKEKLEENLTCPISQQIFINPYITPEGQSFDKAKIEEAIENNGRNPLTKNKLESNELRQNNKARELLEIYAEFNDDINALEKLNDILKKNENEYYKNPVVEENGDTREGKSNEDQYRNLILKTLIEQISELLNEDFNFLDEMNNEGNKIVPYRNKRSFPSSEYSYTNISNDDF